MDPRSKIFTHSQADAWVADQHAAGRRIGFTCGSFDLLHPGHVQYLADARALCDALLVAVNTDDSVRRYKSPLRPIFPQDHRMFVVAGLASVDAVTTLEENRPLSLLLRWKPDLYIKGGDYAASSLRSGDAVRAYGGRVEVIRPTFDTSTTAALERIAALAAHAAPLPSGSPEPSGLVLLDRDGCLIRNVPFLSEPDRVELTPGAGEALASLQSAGFRLAIVTNQQGVALGYASMQEMIAVNQRIFRELAPFGVRISRVYFCPHSLADQCDCRKPRPGMVRRALADFGVPAYRAFMVGDSAADMQAGAAAGCPTVYVGDPPVPPCDFRAGNLGEAAGWIVSRVASLQEAGR